MTILTDTPQTIPTAANADEFGRLMAAEGFRFQDGTWVKGNLRISHRVTYIHWRQDGKLPAWVVPVKVGGSFL